MTIKKTFETGCGYTKEDWDAVDSSPLTDEELIRLKPAKDVLSSSFFKYVTEERRKRGRSPVESPKQAVTLRLDPNVIVSTTFSFLRKGRGVVFLKLSSFHDNFC
ncbi:BrnA antitoxin family protein [Bartonella grahamii]|uniref:BrnA antitoxin family protein n=1 Tax=Bartonella grahamii TaxID=33045 RepID=UPI002E7B1C7D|nr:BrnA antitoxin family protein [Bartonella grahamii]